jgi:hypothetical protein
MKPDGFRVRGPDLVGVSISASDPGPDPEPQIPHP